MYPLMLSCEEEVVIATSSFYFSLSAGFGLTKKKHFFLVAGVSVLMFTVIIAKSDIFTTTAQVARVFATMDARGDE